MSTVLYCAVRHVSTVLYCAVIYCTVLYCKAREYCTVLSGAALDIEGERRFAVALFIRDEQSILPSVASRALEDIQRELGALDDHPVLHVLLLQLPAVLHPGEGGGRGVDRRLEGGRGGLLDGEGGREPGEVGAGHLLPGHLDDKGAGGEALSGVVEGLAGVGAGILREHLGDHQAVALTRHLDR